MNVTRKLPLADCFTLYSLGQHRALVHMPKNGDFGLISATERSCTARISKVERDISDSLLQCDRYSGRSGSE